MELPVITLNYLLLSSHTAIPAAGPHTKIPRFLESEVSRLKS